MHPTNMISLATTMMNTKNLAPLLFSLYQPRGHKRLLWQPQSLYGALKVDEEQNPVLIFF
jgi:hypothetical protein